MLSGSSILVSPVTTCTYNPNESGKRTITFTTTTNYSSVTLMSLTVTSIRNPDSVRFLESFQVTAGAESTSFHDTISYSPAELASGSVTNAVQTAGTATTMTFTFRITNPIPQGGSIKIIYPSQIQFKRLTTDGLVSVTVYGAAKSGFTVEHTLSTRTFLIRNLFPTAGISPDSQDIVVQIQQLNNPESQITSNSFNIFTLDSAGNEIDRKTSGLTISSTSPGTISLSFITPSSTSADAQVTVQIYETTDISTSNAFLRIYWPSEITYLTSGTLTCTMTFGFTPRLPPCTADTVNKYLELAYYRSNNHLYTVGTFRNPLAAIPTSTWKLVVYDSSNNIIMQQTTGITYTTTVNAITVNTSTRPSATTTVGLRADYQLTFVPSTRMLSDSIIRIIFPVDQVKYDGTTKCFNGSTNLGCTITNVDADNFKVEITQWCAPGAE